MKLAQIAVLSVVSLTAFSRPGHAETLTFAGACDRGPELTIAAGGDLLFHRRLQRQSYASKQGSRSLFSPQMRRLITAADIAYANFEGPSAEGVAGFGRRVKDPGPRMDQRVYNGYPMFNYHPSMIDGLKSVGFDIVSTSNNHSLDRGVLGVTRTIVNMNRRGMPFTGTRFRKLDNGPPAFGDWSRIVKRNGFTTAWLACAEMTNGLPDRRRQVLMCHRDRKAIMSELHRLKNHKAVDAVFLTPHWGAENQHRPQRRHRLYARAAVEAGATAVIGTHPHVLQPWEKITTADGREGLAIYSTGNFISGQVRYMQRAGILALLRLVRPEGGKARLASAGYIPSWVSFARGRRVVTANTGREGSLAAARKTVRILPAGNRIAPKLPFQMPNNCRIITAAEQRLVALSTGRHPAPLEVGSRQTAPSTTKSRTRVAEQATQSPKARSKRRKPRRLAQARKNKPVRPRHSAPFKADR